MKLQSLQPDLLEDDRDFKRLMPHLSGDDSLCVNGVGICSECRIPIPEADKSEIVAKITVKNTKASSKEKTHSRV